VRDDLGGLYQDVILDHGRRPRNFREPPDANRRAEGYNPLCGDKLTLYLKVEGDRVVDAAFKGSGCAISTASASILTETVKGKTRREVEELFEKFHQLVTGKRVDSSEDLGKLEVFSGVSEYPVRVKCAALAWHTLRGALENAPEPVTTE